MEETRLYMYSSFPFLDSRKKDRSKFSSKGRLAVSRHHVDDICLRSLPLARFFRRSMIFEGDGREKNR